MEAEKYTFRCFLLQLGLIAEEYKTTRKILMKNLEGNAAWKNKYEKEDSIGERWTSMESFLMNK